MIQSSPASDVESQVPAGPSRAFSLFVWRHRVAWFVGLLVVMIAADQASKLWAQDALAVATQRPRIVEVDGQETRVEETVYLHKRTIEIVPQALSFIYRENRAAAFSLTQSIPESARRPLLLFVSALAMAFISAWYFRQRRPDGLLMTAFALIIAGAVGNFIDRIRLGYVIDFINMYAGFIDRSWPPWPTYNIADSCIVVGALSVVYRTFRPLYPLDDDDGKAVTSPVETKTA